MDVDDTGSARTTNTSGQPREAHRKTSKKDLDEALQESERLLSEIDGGRRRIAVAQAVSLALMVVVLLAVVLPEAGSHDPVPVWAALVAAFAAVITIAAIGQSLITVLSKQVRRDELIMSDLVGMQRALLPLLARNEEWSSAQLILAEKRLERFPIEPEQKSQLDRIYRFR
jgi:hypothetical protein